MSGFGDNLSNDYTKCKNGSYPATIVSAKVVMENGVPKLHPESQKQSVKVGFQLDMESQDGPIELERTFGLTFGKNRQTGEYSAWANMVAVFTMIPAGDQAQRHVGEPELIGKRAMVRTKNVEKNGNKYTNIVDFEEIEDVPAPVAAANRAVLAAAIKTPETRLGLEEGDLEEIPF